MSAFVSLRDPASRAYYDRERDEGKKQTAALLCLFRCRSDVLYAVIPSPKFREARAGEAGLTCGFAVARVRVLAT